MNKMELEIKGEIYSFKFGMGFLLDINKTYEVDSGNRKKEKAGLAYNISGLIDKNPESLLAVLETANKTENPRITKGELMAYIEDEDTDIDNLFDTVMDFLSSANSTKNMTLKMKLAAKEAEEEEKEAKKRQRELMGLLNQ